MSSGGTVPFEQRVRMLLEENAQQASGHIRSRLNQARHAAVAVGGVSRIGWRGRQLWMPATGMVAAAAVAAFLLWPHGPPTSPPSVGANAIATGDLDLLTDRDGLTLVEHGDGEFYEWAVYEAQDQQGAGSEGGHAD